MQKRHAPSEVYGMTLCGYECTPSEFEAMQRRGTKYLNCKRCQDALKLRELIKNDEI